MTLYLNHFFATGESLQVGSAETLEITTKEVFAEFQYDLRSADPHRIKVTEGNVSLFGHKNRDGSRPVAGSIDVPKSVADMPALSKEQLVAIVNALVHMLGGAVTISGSELESARHANSVATQYRDPYMLKINSYRKETL